MKNKSLELWVWFKYFLFFGGITFALFYWGFRFLGMPRSDPMLLELTAVSILPISLWYSLLAFFVVRNSFDFIMTEEEREYFKNGKQ